MNVSKILADGGFHERSYVEAFGYVHRTTPSFVGVFQVYLASQGVGISDDAWIDVHEPGSGGVADMVARGSDGRVEAVIEFKLHNHLQPTQPVHYLTMFDPHRLIPVVIVTGPAIQRPVMRKAHRRVASYLAELDEIDLDRLALNEPPDIESLVPVVTLAI